MSYCLNPICPKPQDRSEVQDCLVCGTKLLLGDRYRAIKPLGQGGFGRTFLAVDEYKPSKPRCVIKQFFPQNQGTNNVEKATELFAKEAVRLEELGKHPQIPELFAYFTQDKRQYLVQEFIDGLNLAQALTEAGCLNQTQIRALLADLLPVLEFVHDKQIIHRDIKPENVIRRQNGKLVLVDFGAAKFATGTALIKTGTVIGSPEYIAPEQIRGKANFASDLFSLGVTCIHLLTQVSPFDLFDTSEDAWVWRSFLSQNPLTDIVLGEVLDKMIENAVSRRYQSATDILQDLDLSKSFSPEPAKQIDPAPVRIPVKPINPPSVRINTSTPAQTIIVAQFGGADYQTIGEAIQAATAGSCILVRPGVYRESLVIDKRLVLVGDGSNPRAIIESTDSICISIQTNYAEVRGFILREYPGKEGGEFPAVDIQYGKAIFENCDIKSDSSHCITIYGLTSNPTIRHCKIHNGKKNGILIAENGKGTIEDCDIFANEYSGVIIESGGDPIIRRCKIYDGKEIGVFVRNDGKGTIEDCDIFANECSGVTIELGGDPIIRRCKIHNGKENGVWVRDNGKGTIEDCDIFSNKHAGLHITSGGDPLIRRCKINHNELEAIWVGKNGKGTIEDCDLTNNKRGAFHINLFSLVKQRRNKRNIFKDFLNDTLI